MSVLRATKLGRYKCEHCFLNFIFGVEIFKVIEGEFLLKLPVDGTISKNGHQ